MTATKCQEEEPESRPRSALLLRLALGGPHPAVAARWPVWQEGGR